MKTCYRGRLGEKRATRLQWREVVTVGGFGVETFYE